jgi:CDP-diacylglycerol--glycerol-3-phosphate 3-phosphatidyltransferase
MAISLYKLKPAFIRLLMPLASFLARSRVTANQVTAAACLLSVGYSLSLLWRPDAVSLWALLPVWLFLRMAFNAVDGILARDFGQKSRLGGLLNEMGDVIADAALFLPLALLPGVSVIAVAVFIWMALLTEFAGVLGLLINAPRRYDGPLGKSDRAFCLGLAAFAVACAYRWEIQISCALNVGLWICSALMVRTTWNRLKNALQGNAA